MVPEGWFSAKIGEIANIQVGRDLKEEAYSEVATNQHTIPVFSNTVENRGLYGYYNFEEYPGNSVTIVGRGIGLGTAFSRKSGFGAIGRLLIVSPRNGSFDVEYLENYINFRLRIFNESGGIPQLPGASLAKYSVTLPPLSEQKKIARILSTWDKAIETVKKLIENSKAQKKALMQQLLTGKRRLPGFDGEWGEIRLKQICSIKKGGQLNRDTLDKSGKYPVVNGGIEPSGYTRNYNTEKETITISEGGNSCGFVSFMEKEFWCGGHCYALNSVKINNLYLYHFLKFIERNISKRPRIHTCFPHLTLCRLSPGISRHRRNRWTCLMPPKARHSGSHTLRPSNNLA